VRRVFVVRRLVVLSVIFSASALASAIGTCAPSAVSTIVGNPCRLGDAMFSNFSYSGNIDPAKVSVNFQMANNGAEYRVILAPMSDAGFLTHFTFSDTITSTASHVVGLKASSDFSISAGAAGALSVSNSDGTNFDLSPGHESGGPTAIADTQSVTTLVNLIAGSPGVSSVQLGYLLQPSAVGALSADPIVVPEPSSWGFLAIGLAGLSLIRRRIS